MFPSAYPARAPSNSQCSLRSWVGETSEQASNGGCYRYNSGTLTAVMLGFKGVERDPCAKFFAECPRLRRGCGPLGRVPPFLASATIVVTKAWQHYVIKANSTSEASSTLQCSCLFSGVSTTSIRVAVSSV